jgi:membrane fusion protein, multidrug efflux system
MHTAQPLRVDALDREDMHELAHGTLLTLDNQVDTTTGTVRARATFANEDNELFPNELVNARLLVRTLRGVSLVPEAAIQRNGDQAFVYVADLAAATVDLRNITVTESNANLSAANGVNPGETVVVNGFDRLEDGAKVSIRPEGASTPGPAQPRTPPTGQASSRGGAASPANTSGAQSSPAPRR